MSYGLQASYQQNNNVSGGLRYANYQESFNMFFNINSTPSSRLSLTSTASLDFVRSQSSGVESIQLLPNITVQLSSKSLIMGVGYRKVMGYSTVIVGSTNSTNRDDASEYFADGTLTVGRLPALRFRYGVRDQKQFSNGVLAGSTGTNDFAVATTFRLWLMNITADYRTQNSKDKIGGGTTDSTQLNASVDLAKQVGRMSLRFRDVFSLSESGVGGTTVQSTFNDTAEAHMGINLLKRMGIGVHYVYRIADTLINSPGPTINTTLVGTVNYSFPRLVGIYGIYVDATGKDPNGKSDNPVHIEGITFNDTIGRLSIASRFERRDSSVTSQPRGGVQSKGKDSNNNFDLVFAERLTRYLSLTLSDSYAAATNAGGTSQVNYTRLQANFGPINNFTMTPNASYIVTIAQNGDTSKNTEVTVPASFALNLHQRVQLSLSDNFRWSQAQDPSGNTSSSQSNSITGRLVFTRLFPNTNLSADASYSTSGSSGAPTTSTSSYNLSGSWSKSPHRVTATCSYQMGSNTTASMSMSVLYAVNFRMKKLYMSLNARYNYATVFTNITNSTSAFSVYLTVRK